MIRSALMRRVYIFVLVALIVSCICTWLLFLYLSSSVFVNMRIRELMPRAESLAGIVERYISGQYEEEALLSLVDETETDSSIINAYLAVTDASGEILLISDKNNLLNLTGPNKQIESILSGKNVVYVANSGPYGDIVTLGVPVYGDNQHLLGALILYVPQYEALAARGALAGSLAISMLIVVPAVFLLMYGFLYRVIRPLKQMRDVALRMADGRFDRLANEEIPGEIGQLGSSLNRLSKTLKHTISALTFERNRLVQILNGLSEGIAAVDRLGNITHINPALDNLFRRNDCLSDPRLRIINRPDIWEAFDNAVQSGAQSDFSIQEDGIDIFCAISPVHDDAGSIQGAVGLFRNISKEVQLEKTRREYVANVSHEMRTPLTAVRGLIEPLRDGMVTNEETRKRYYDIILREVLRLSRLINDLLELSRLQSGTVSIHPEEFLLSDLIEDVAERYGAISCEHRLTLTVDTDFTKCPPLYSNPDRIEQLMVILLDNAIKYTPEGGGVSISGDFSGERAVVSVRDTGQGISSDHLQHIFERFYKVDKSHSGLGSGLGLSIAKEVLTRMGERIWVESKEDEGSVFSFTIRFAREGALMIE
ncbi:MAG: HAMP domain-containing protein [Clostridia bacterium]|nr:HAMP domain-containing protein [Clostridia bacterium]